MSLKNKQNYNLSSDIAEIESNLKSQPESYWIDRGEKSALRLFHQMAEKVPAYADFLQSNKIDSNKIKTTDDIKHVPPIDKDNYLRKYPRSMLCWDGDFKRTSWTISSTSGSTGVPYYFPRTRIQDEQYALTAELYLRSNFRIQDNSTLYINAFALGVWIGGLFTYEAIKQVSEKGDYNLSIINPGISKQEVINTVKNLASEFDQIIIGCYPPLMKDILDMGVQQGVAWEDISLGFVFSAESFNEHFRDYIIDTAGLQDAYKSTLNHYGTVDLGTMSHETPLTVYLRRKALEDEGVYGTLFGDIVKLPTLTQYVPEMFYFEETDSSLLCTANSGYPLFRYNLKDKGGIKKFSDLKDDLDSHGIDIDKEAQENNFKDTLWNLPMVYVYERLDLSVSFQGFQVYPETIRKVLDRSPFNKMLTGKCTLSADYDDKSNQHLYIHIETKQGVNSTDELQKELLEAIVEQLNKDSSEYRHNYENEPDKLTPIIEFWPYGHPEHFNGKGKQKWVKK